MRTDPAPLKRTAWRNGLRPMVAHRASFRCEHCRVYLGLKGDVDHVIPRSHCEDVGVGIYDASNLQYLCTSCHSQKTNRERWAGHTKRDRVPRRTKLPGRDDFLDAAGIQQQEDTPC